MWKRIYFNPECKHISKPGFWLYEEICPKNLPWNLKTISVYWFHYAKHFKRLFFLNSDNYLRFSKWKKSLFFFKSSASPCLTCLLLFNWPPWRSLCTAPTYGDQLGAETTIGGGSELVNVYPRGGWWLACQKTELLGIIFISKFLELFGGFPYVI